MRTPLDLLRKLNPTTHYRTQAGT